MIATIVVLCLISISQESSALETRAVPSFEHLPKWPAPSYGFLGKYTSAAITVDHKLCSEIGKDVLILGGNAVDAAIASQFCTGLMHGQSSGIGGGHFITIYHKKTGSCSVIDARETAPNAANKHMFNNTQTGSKIGWKSIGVPGELHGLWTAFKKYGSGRIKWKELIQPTIDMAENGYPVSEAMAKALKVGKKYISKNTTFNVFINPQTGKVYEKDEIMKRPTFAGTLREIALSSDPIQLFYSGSLASKVVKEFEHYGALITKEDLNQYRSKIRKDVIETKLMNDLGMCGPPPPSSAALVQSIVKIIDNFGITHSANLSSVEGNVMVYHRMIEAMKFAYAKRSELADMDYNRNALKIARNITSERYTRWVQQMMITDKAHNVSYYGGKFVDNSEDHGTSHLNVVDDEGNAVALTSSLNLHFGSWCRSPETGIIWNDQMDDFSSPGKENTFGIPPSPANFIKPGKRPMSSMSPVIVFNKKSREFKLAVGAAGGSRIISAVAYIVMRALWFNETIKNSIDAPRLHNQLRPEHTSYEPGFPVMYIEQLKLHGQIMKQFENPNLVIPSVAMAIERGDDHILYANSDSRKGTTSQPAGYSDIQDTKNKGGQLDYNKCTNILCVILLSYV